MGPVVLGVSWVLARSLTSSVIGVPRAQCTTAGVSRALDQLNHENRQVKYPGPWDKAGIQGPGEKPDQLNYGNKWEEDPGPWALSVS
jgi:hypothetical protein